MTRQNNLLQLKIFLQASKPPIWREIIVPANYTFFDLHVAIQAAFSWGDCHLHQFFTSSPYKSGRHFKIIAWPMEDAGTEIDERKARLSEYFTDMSNAMYYEYDFGDGWMHKIELKKILVNDKKLKYPQIIGGARACPPDDCGGLWGYYHLIETVKNPKHKGHKDMMDWLGIKSPDELDPEYFNKDEINFKDPKKILKEYKKSFDL